METRACDVGGSGQGQGTPQSSACRSCPAGGCCPPTGETSWASGPKWPGGSILRAASAQVAPGRGSWARVLASTASPTVLLLLSWARRCCCLPPAPYHLRHPERRVSAGSLLDALSQPEQGCASSWRNRGPPAGPQAGVGSS